MTKSSVHQFFSGSSVIPGDALHLDIIICLILFHIYEKLFLLTGSEESKFRAEEKGSTNVRYLGILTDIPPPHRAYSVQVQIPGCFLFFCNFCLISFYIIFI